MANKRIHGEGGETDAGDAAVKRARREDNFLDDLPTEMRGVIRSFLPLASASSLARASRLHYEEFWPAVAREFKPRVVEGRIVAPAVSAFFDAPSGNSFERMLAAVANNMADLFLDYIYEEEEEDDFMIPINRQRPNYAEHAHLYTAKTHCKLLRRGADAAEIDHVPLVQLDHRVRGDEPFRYFGVTLAPGLLQRNPQLADVCEPLLEGMWLAHNACTPRDRDPSFFYERFAVDVHLARLFLAILMMEEPTAVACSVHSSEETGQVAHMVGALVTNGTRWTRHINKSRISRLSNMFDTPQSLWTDFLEETHVEEKV